MQTFIERGEVIALDCSHPDTILFYDPSYGPYEKCVECEVILDEEDAPADNDLTDDELPVDEVTIWVCWRLGALTATTVVGLGLVWAWVTA
ncbi:hypothetical protein GS491_19025 [Rhodococcus hoagii]|nr:hypothetical protein [Prescottella equi]MBM4521296.1 hypothetical protein [Prescottella equi]NKR48775.1 hypothetical protein [Prescottella equi]NKR79428.1 hypothetical protein [Prescottella equi]NKT01836.1 hypothetical protein [Prescottella equi]